MKRETIDVRDRRGWFDLVGVSGSDALSNSLLSFDIVDDRSPDGVSSFPTNLLLLKLMIHLGDFVALSLSGSVLTLYKISDNFLLIMKGPDQPLVSLSETSFFLAGVNTIHFAPTLNPSGAIPLYALDR